MAQLVIPDRRFQSPDLYSGSRKPVSPVQVDWTHRLTRGLVGSWVFLDGKPVNLVKGSAIGAGTSDYYIERNELISPSGQPAGNTVLSHSDVDVFTTGGSLVVGLKLDSYPNAFGSIACIDYINNTGKNGFTVGVQGSNLLTYWRAGGGYVGTKRIGVTFGKKQIISCSTDSAHNHALILNGVVATSTANDFWLFGTGLVAPNLYNSTRGDIVGQYYVYHVFDRELSEKDLMSLNRYPYQFYIPA